MNEQAVRVVFICTGNTCRSPLAEALARSTIADCPSTGRIDIVSAGLQAVGGQPASEGSLAVAAAAGADLSRHFSQQMCPELLAGAGWTIGMTRSHVALFKARYGDLFTGRIGLLGQPGVDQSDVQFSTEAEEVADPYGGSLATYEAVGAQIHRLVRDWIPHFETLGQQDGGTE